ncbi:hypothetical protein E3N88_30798 [Mikania micrantha]|uniref:F-box domain-containing protein n=1 Tax=Mikania micrantha TaxID=192012 RepID=A0A5N6MQN1_9ASTR|nr:hypothetical protein E3N88_30798 [Mikania micrantha]
MNVEEDGLSSLPDDLIHKILSFVSIKHVVETSVLSSRWRFIWTSMPYLNLSSEDFPSLPKFSQVVTRVLSWRNDHIEVESLKLSLHGRVSQAFVKRIMNYAFSHNVQQMTVTCQIEKKIVFPLSLFCSRSLKHLTLIGSVNGSVASTWELPALTTLHLGHVTLNDDDVESLSKFPNLKNLTLDGCKILGLDGFSIYHSQLSCLTLQNGDWGSGLVDVVAPQLKNLTVVNCDWVHLSAPNLASFIFRSVCSLEFSSDSLPLLAEVDLCINNPHKTDAHVIVSLLQKFYSVKSLTLNLETVEVLCSSVELITSQPSPFANLRSLKIYPANIQSKGLSQKKVVVFEEVKKFLLDGSPSASSTWVTREEIKARDVTLAQHLIEELWVMLEQDKARISWDHMERGETQIECYWEDLSTQSQFEKTMICDIISKLQHIEGLLAKLSASNRARLQSSFSNLCAEANLVIKKIDRTWDPQASH